MQQIILQITFEKRQLADTVSQMGWDVLLYCILAFVRHLYWGGPFRIAASVQGPMRKNRF